MNYLDDETFNHICDLETKDADELRVHLQNVERLIKEIVGYDPTFFFKPPRLRHDDTSNLNKWEDVEHLLMTRHAILNRMFAATPEEVARFEEVNEHLLNLTDKMYHRTCSAYRHLLAGGREEDWDDDYEVEGTLALCLNYIAEDKRCYEVLRLENDGYYGSDFEYMMCLVNDYQRYVNGPYGKNLLECGFSWMRNHRADMTDEELDCVNRLDHLEDVHSWAEGIGLRHPNLEHIRVCYAIHAICAHNEYTVPDLLRMNQFWVETNLTVQHITDLRGRRYKEIRKDYDRIFGRETTNE